MENLAALSAVYEATRALGLSEDLEKLLDEILRQAQQLIGFEHCALMLLDGDTGELAVRRILGYGESAERILKLRLKPNEGLSGWAAQHRKAVRVGDVSRDPRYVEGLEEARSNLIVPLIVRNDVVGVLNVESHRLEAFSEEHEKQLTVLGTQAALAIEAWRSRERLEQRLRHLNALYRISQLATQSIDVESILSAGIEVVRDVVPHGYCAFLLLDPERQVLKVHADRGYFPGVGELEIPVGKGVTGRCAATGRVLRVDDVSREPDYIKGVPNAHSEIALPLVADGRVIGVLNAESEQPAAYSLEHVRTLSVVAQQVAVVVRSRQLQEETRRLAITDPLTGLFNRRHLIAELEEHLSRARRYQEGLAVAFLDLDEFKGLNDRFGHTAGDLVLQAVATLMRAWARDTDEVARMGGDEFAAVLLQVDSEQARQTVERLLETVARLEVEVAEDTTVQVTLSAGIAVFPGHGATADVLLNRSDAALFEAKRQGRNRVLLAPAAEAPKNGS